MHVHPQATADPQGSAVFFGKMRLQRPGLTGVRALAAGLVLAFHLFAYARIERLALLGFDFTPLVTVGWVGVGVFFVLSGFLLTIHVVEQLEERGSVRGLYGGYMRRRILRVVPAYWTQIALLVAVAWVTTGKWPAWISAVPLHLVFLQNFSPSAYAAINGVYWSMPVEFSFYLLLPLLVGALLRPGLDARVLRLRAALVALGGFAIAAGTRWYFMWKFGSTEPSHIFFATFTQLPGCADMFAAGVAAALLFIASGAPDATVQASWARPGDAIALAGLALLVLAMYWIDARVSDYWRPTAFYYFWYCLASLSIALIVFGVAMRGPIARALFENAPIIWLGTISYSIYLWHLILAPHIASAVDAANLSWAAFALVASPAIVAVSAASYYLVERPFLRLKRPAGGPRTLQ